MFRFQILQVWTFEGQPNISAIGILEEGKIIPPVTASVVDHNMAVQIESIAIGGGKPVTGRENELTLVIRRPEIEPKSLENCYLSAAEP